MTIVSLSPPIVCFISYFMILRSYNWLLAISKFFYINSFLSLLYKFGSFASYECLKRMQKTKVMHLFVQGGKNHKMEYKRNHAIDGERLTIVILYFTIPRRIIPNNMFSIETIYLDAKGKGDCRTRFCEEEGTGGGRPGTKYAIPLMYRAGKAPTVNDAPAVFMYA
jgi:hypothetical protein